MTAWHQILRLRPDVKSDTLSQKQFAADLYDVMTGRNTGVYHDPKEFFALTYPTTRLRDLARDVTWRLAGNSEKAVRQLHMTFGGGKTHSLIALVHLVQSPETLPDIPAVQQFRAHCGIDLPKARVAAVVFDHLDAEMGMEVRAPDGTLGRFKMPWSVLAWQLGGPAAMKLLELSGSERATVPATNVLEDVLALGKQDAAGVLVLFDEVLWYVRAMADHDPSWIGRMADFLHSLTQAIAKTPNCCLVASLLASDTKKMDELGKKISKELYDEFKRVADEGIQPVEQHDVPEILRRRLFDLASYTDTSRWPQQVMAAINGIEKLDEQTAKHRAREEQEYVQSYPFHPGLMSVLYGKWTSLENFQQTRGILKTLASALRDAERWDTSPIIGPQVFLNAEGIEGLSAATRELASVAQLEQYEGRTQNWPAILQAEFELAAKAQDGLRGLKHREIEQAVIATFLHSQPIGQRAVSRDLKLLLGAGTPDRIEIDKGLQRWAETSWYLDDTFTGDREAGLPKLWRLGSKPNLRQMHFDARQHIALTVVEEVLDTAIRDARKLTEGVRAYGAKSHLLPTRPHDIEDDGEFHYAVLGPKAASESGKPSTDAKRYLDETTGPDRPRATNRNAVVLAVPSREGIDLAREKVRDLVGWEKVRELLKERNDIDMVAQARLETNLRAARNEMASQIVMAYCIAVTVNEKNEVAAYRIAIDNDPLFPKLVKDHRLRIESTAVNAEALLPGGPYDLWITGEKARYVKDLVGAFAATAHLPKMLNRAAILDTLIQGCIAGDFVLRVTRADKSIRTFWKVRPDEQALHDPSLEVMLSDAAELVELDAGLLAPGALTGLWKDEALTWPELTAFFSGMNFVPIDKGGYTENLLIPKASEECLRNAVVAAVKAARVWLINSTVSVCGELMPPALIDGQMTLLAPPPPVAATELLPQSLSSAWTDNETSAQALHAAISSRIGKPLPWTVLRQGLDEAFRLGLLERTLDSGAWPCDQGGASSVRFRARIPAGRLDATEPAPTPYGTRTATTELATHELQDFTYRVDEFKQLVAGCDTHLRLTIELHDTNKVASDILEQISAFLTSIKDEWKF